MESILQLIQKCQTGDKNSKERLLIQMEPLIKHYASKIHFIDYEDAYQEFSVELLCTIPYLNIEKTEAQNLSYMKTAIKNRYAKLCSYYLKLPKTEDISSYYSTLESSSDIDETYYDIVCYINSFSTNSIPYKVLSLIFYEDKSDKEIAKLLGISRQYVNRIRKKMIKNYFTDLY